MCYREENTTLKAPARDRGQAKVTQPDAFISDRRWKTERVREKKGQADGAGGEEL